MRWISLNFIQATRYVPDRCVPPKFIRELRGSFSSATGIFITTGKFSDQAQADAEEAAKFLNISASNIYTAKSRCISTLREIIKTLDER